MGVHSWGPPELDTVLVGTRRRAAFGWTADMAGPRTGRPKPTIASRMAWLRRKLMASSCSVRRGSWAAATTTVDPRSCHIDEIEIAPSHTEWSQTNSGAKVRWQRWAAQVVRADSLGSTTTVSV